jgi:hypothetical protein
MIHIVIRGVPHFLEHARSSGELWHKNKQNVFSQNILRENFKKNFVQQEAYKSQSKILAGRPC